jgi:hypothetical protein
MPLYLLGAEMNNPIISPGAFISKIMNCLPIHSAAKGENVCK